MRGGAAVRLRCHHRGDAVGQWHRRCSWLRCRQWRQSCATESQTCADDPACAAEAQCAIDQGDFSDECGGGLPGALVTCLTGCPCLVASHMKVSRVTRLDFDESEGAGQALDEVLAEAPIRVVGAADSVCVPLSPR